MSINKYVTTFSFVLDSKKNVVQKILSLKGNANTSSQKASKPRIKRFSGSEKGMLKLKDDP